MTSSPNTLSLFHCDAKLISEFDDSDLSSENREISLKQSETSSLSSVVPAVKQSVLIGSLIEQLCSLYEPDAKKSRRLYFILCDRLAKLGFVSPTAYLKEFTSVRTQYKAVLYNIINSSIIKLDDQLVLNPKDKIGGITKRKPKIIDPGKVFDFDISRYNHEFLEKEKLGTGGYGQVYHVQSKIDGQEYAIKKITLSSSLSPWENNDVLFREVHVLATLHHINIVRYHSAWIEHHHKPLPKSKSEKTFMRKREKYSRTDLRMLRKFQTFPNILCESSFESGSSVSIIHTAQSEISQTGKHTPSLIPPGRFGEISNGTPMNDQVVGDVSSKFWKEGSDGSSSDDEVIGNKIFSISPTSSDEEDVAFEKPVSGECGIQQHADKVAGPEGVILTDGVRRDIMRRAKSFVILKNTTDKVGDIPLSNGISNTTKRTHSLSNLELHEIENETAILQMNSNVMHHPVANTQDKLILFIQMQLCQMSLKQWLLARNRDFFQNNKYLAEDVILNILKQILCALEFIHSKGLIHRDVKPPNIFLNGSSKPHILLGDFGLAKTDLSSGEGQMPPLVSQDSKPLLSRKDSVTHTSGVGTTTYAAPEQLKGALYDAKVDMYSVGIVCFELWKPFGTAMERSKQIDQLRKRAVPLEFSTRFPEQTKLIVSLIEHDPRKRPSARDIVRGEFFEKSKDIVIEEQRKQIDLLTKENDELKALVGELRAKS